MVYPRRDVAKKALLLPKIMLEAVMIWPEQTGGFKNFWVFVVMFLLFWMGFGQVLFLWGNIGDISKIASSMSTVSITFQGITKIFCLYFYGDVLKEILGDVWFQFWPSNLVGENLEKSLENVTFLAIGVCISVYIPAVLYDFAVLCIPLTHDDFELPFESIYPFDYQYSPLYEIFYVLQWFANLYVNVHAICGCDYFFLCLCVNVVAQFRLLQHCLSKIGTKNEEILRLKIKDCPNLDLMELCILHHQKLLQIGDKLNHVFMMCSFVQMFCSVTALCVSCFLITMIQIEPALMAQMTIYVFGHLVQLFIYCVAGNELSHQSQLVSNSIFNSKWYKKTTKTKHSIQILMMRAQKPIVLTAWKLVDLNYSTFIATVKLSASFYKFLSTIQEKHKP